MMVPRNSVCICTMSTQKSHLPLVEVIHGNFSKKDDSFDSKLHGKFSSCLELYEENAVIRLHDSRERKPME